MMACETMRDAIGERAQMLKADWGDAAIGFRVEDGNSVWVDRGPPITDINADIVASRQVPAEPGINPVILSIRWQHGGTFG